jgi:hypothetical protein
MIATRTVTRTAAGNAKSRISRATHGGRIEDAVSIGTVTVMGFRIATTGVRTILTAANSIPVTRCRLEPGGIVLARLRRSHIRESQSWWYANFEQ